MVVQERRLPRNDIKKSSTYRKWHAPILFFQHSSDKHGITLHWITKHWVCKCNVYNSYYCKLYSDHPLGRHSDNLTAIETRVSLLNMTFMKYVDSSLCCFFPGKVIDEIYTVLRKIKQTKNLSRSCEVLQVRSTLTRQSYC